MRNNIIFMILGHRTFENGVSFSERGVYAYEKYYIILTEVFITLTLETKIYAGVS